MKIGGAGTILRAVTNPLKDNYLLRRAWWVAAVVSWGVALFEYLLQVPANRIGYAGGLSLAQLKIA